MTGGNHKMRMINIPQENKKANRVLKSSRKAEVGIRAKVIPSTVTAAEK
tara:strand:+ start:542 stop:688 length:147 start_codon:yes stop_codon:yes gene_type:complete